MPNGEDKKLNFIPKVLDPVTKTYRPIYIAPDATDKVQGDVFLTDEVNDDLDAATGMTAVTPKALSKFAETVTANVKLVTTENDGLIAKLPGQDNLYFNGLGLWEKIKGIGGLFMFEVDEKGDLYQLYFEEEDLQEFQLDPNGDFWAVFDDEHKLYLGNLRDELVADIEQGGTGASTRDEAFKNLVLQNQDGWTDVGSENGADPQWWYKNNGLMVVATIKDNDWLPKRVLESASLSILNPAIIMTYPFRQDHYEHCVFQQLFNAQDGYFFRISYNGSTWSEWIPGANVAVGYAGLAPELPENPYETDGN